MFWPYHHAVTQDIAQLWRHGPPPANIAVQSNTTVFNGMRRPWDIGQ
jgi:predicted N-formylglutamate amidohydrolase